MESSQKPIQPLREELPGSGQGQWHNGPDSSRLDRTERQPSCQRSVGAGGAQVLRLNRPLGDRVESLVLVVPDSARIYGIGPAKAARYGEDLLAAVRAQR